MELKDYREHLDQIDDQILSLFKQRMEVVKDIAAFKKANNTPVLNTNREEEILHRVTGIAGEELQEYARNLFITLMKLSRDYQTNLLTEEKNAASCSEEG